MKILVTGGCGFIGSNFIQHILSQTGWDVINIDLLTYAGVSQHQPHPRYTFYQADIGTPGITDILIKHHPDYIINFAAETHVDRSIAYPDAFINTNVLGTYKFICYLMEYHKVNPNFKFVHVSTDEVFGQLRTDELTFTEKSQYAPNSPYSATKASSDHLVRSFHHTYGLPAIITHCSNNYGPYQHTEKFIPKAILRAHQDLPILVYGNGKNIRDWLYVTDHCDALLEVLRRGKVGETYNIGGEMELSNNEVVRRILLYMNKPLSMFEYVEDRKGHDFRYAINISHIKNELGWRPKVDFTAGLSRTINWYLNNLQWVAQCVISE